MLLAQLSEYPAPQANETTCILSLTEGPGGTYRLRAFTAGGTPRDIGRWMSDCPLSVAESALLWVTRFEWQIQQQQGSLDINLVLDVVERPEPMNPIDPTTGQFVHPLDTLATIAANLPPKDPTSPETGARLQLGIVAPPAPPGAPPIHRGLISGPIQQAPHQPVSYVHQPAPPQQKIARPPPGPPVGAVQPVERPGQLGDAERELARFMRDLVVGMRQGQPIEEVREQMLIYVGGAVAEGFEDDLPGLDEYPPAVLELAGQLIRANPIMDEENAIDQAFSIYNAQTTARFQPGDSPLPALPDGLSPLGPRETMPGEMDPRLHNELDGFGQENPSDRAKLERGWATAGTMRRRADQVSPLPPGVRPAPAGVPTPVPASAHPLAAPRQPTAVPVGSPPAAVPPNGAGGVLSREDADRIASEQIAKAQAAANERAARSAAHRDKARAAHDQELADAAATKAAAVSEKPQMIVVGLGAPGATGEGIEA